MTAAIFVESGTPALTATIESARRLAGALGIDNAPDALHDAVREKLDAAASR